MSGIGDLIKGLVTTKDPGATWHSSRDELTAMFKESLPHISSDFLFLIDVGDKDLIPRGYVSNERNGIHITNVAIPDMGMKFEPNQNLLGYTMPVVSTGQLQIQFIVKNTLL